MSRADELAKDILSVPDNPDYAAALIEIYGKEVKEAAARECGKLDCVDDITRGKCIEAIRGMKLP